MAKVRGKQAAVRVVDEAAMSADERNRIEQSRQRVTRAVRLARAQLHAASSIVANRSPAAARWFCLQVTTGREFALARLLTAAGVENFAPGEAIVVVKRGKKFDVERPLLPGYLLVRFLRSSEAVSGLKRQKGVYDFVRRGDDYHRMTDDELSEFKAILSGNIDGMPVDGTFQDGDRAKIVAGPFKGFRCTLFAVKYSKKPYGRLLIDGDGKRFEIERHPLAFLEKL